MEDAIEDYSNSLADLTQNSKPLINMLTMLAEDNETHAAKIVEEIETHLQQVESTKKLPTLYLIDSIIKNLPKSTYPSFFSHNIVNIFCNMFEQVDEKTRQAMFKVRQTWNQHFASRKLYALDVRVNNIDHAWPLIATPPTASTSSIHVNPRFLAQKEEALPLPDIAPVEDDEAEMRRQLIAKQAELLKLQQKRLELELKETEAKLTHSKMQTSPDLFVGVEDPKIKVDIPPPAHRDPRLQRDPRLATRDPRIHRDPRIRPKPTQSELLPSAESQPPLTFFGPVTNQPLNQYDPQQVEPPKLGEPVLPPAITPQPSSGGMMPHPMPTAAILPQLMPTAAPVITDLGNQNNQALQAVKEEQMDHRPVTPKKNQKPRPIEVRKEKPGSEKSSPKDVENGVKVKVEKSDTASPRKRRSDPRKGLTDLKGKEIKEHDLPKTTSSQPDKSQSSNSEKKTYESNEKGKSKNKEHDRGKSMREEDKGQSKSHTAENQRDKNKRTRGDLQEDNRRKSDERKKTSESKERGKNYDSQNRRSKSPRSNRERSRSPVKGKGLKSQRGGKSRSKTELGSELRIENTKSIEESVDEHKSENRLPISCLPRIPKRSGGDVDERMSEKDRDERRLSASNKRDLDDRHDTRGHDNERSSKKPRISQERDVKLEPVQVETRMTEDISDLFGSEDQDYRHPDVISPRGSGQTGWARFKADHPQDFDSRKASLADVDHRREQHPKDIDYRPAPFVRPQMRSPGFDPSQPCVHSLGEEDIPQQLRLENREQILRKMEFRRKSGEISHDELQQVLHNLSQYDTIQEQKRNHRVLHEPSLLEPEIHRREDHYSQPKSNEPSLEYHSLRKDLRARQNEPSMEYPSPRKNRIGREDRRFEDGVRRGDRDQLPDFDQRDVYRGSGRLEDDRMPNKRPPDFDSPARPSLLGPGPGLRDIAGPERETPVHFDIDHRKPLPLDRGPSDIRYPEIEEGRSPAERPTEERPSLLGPGPQGLLEKESKDKRPETTRPVQEKIRNTEKPTEKKAESSGLAVGAMLEMLRAEETPENSQDGMPKPRSEDVPRDQFPPKSDRGPPADDKAPKLVPNPIYDPALDDRWMMPGCVRMKDGVCITFPEGTEEVVINEKSYPMKLGGPSQFVTINGEKIEVLIDSSRRMIYINGTMVYKISDPVKEVVWGPGPNQRAPVFYHGSPRNLWLDGIQYMMRIDAPPKIIKFRDQDHTVLIDGRDGMLLIDKKEHGTYGGKPRFIRINGERVELRFTPPPRNIVIDGEQCQIRLDRKIPFIVLNNVAKGIRFNGPPREIIINNHNFFIPTDRAVEVCVEGTIHMVAFGGPLHELIIDGTWYEFQFNGPPKELTVGNQKLLVGLPTPPPDVKILDPIENQKLKDTDIDKGSSKRDKRKGSDDRNSPVIGQKGPQKPISILDLNIPKPPGLRNREGRRGSPLNDGRSSDRHRDRRERKRSPHRRRHSPNRRHRSPNRDNKGRGSPVMNDQFNGQPGNMPPFSGPGQQFQPRPNMPFPQNQQFTSPNQPPFVDGPNSRFPSGPNQPPFMPGPNQAFPQGPGPNQAFPPGPHQQIGGPGPIQPFPGPRPPLQQDEGSQGPHPIFQPVHNLPFPPISQGQPIQPNLSIMNQSMPIVSQSMPGQPMGIMQPGAITSTSQPIIPGLMPPQEGIPNLLQPQQPPTLQPEPLNVESLLQKLINAGLINKANTEENEGEKKEEKGEESEMEIKKEESADGKEKKKPVRVKLTKPEKIPDLTDMKMNTLKQQYIGVIQRMYSGIQCTSCGTRFLASHTTLYREHLDWHFRQNQREKKGARISKHRSWFYELNDWLEYEEVGDSEERARTNLFEQQSQETAEKETVLPQGENVLHCPAATGEESADACVVCGDVFEQFFDEESEEWHLKNALRVDGKTYHPVCYEDAQENNTPKEDPGANPMLLQIQKELGYVPADTVVSFPAANVISVSQVDHTPKDLVQETPTEDDTDSKQEVAPT